MQEAAHPIGEVGRDRHARAAISGNARRPGGGADDQILVLHPLHFETQTGEEKGVVGAERGGERLLDFAERAAVAEAHGQHRGLHDDAGVEAELCCEARMADAPEAVHALGQPLVAIIGLERVAAGRDEAEHAVERLGRQRGIGRRLAHLGEQCIAGERLGRRHRHDVLGEHVERAGAEDVGIALARLHGVEGSTGLEIFEAVARHDQRLGGLVEPMVGAAYALEQPRRPLGRAHLHNEIDIAPVDAEIEAGGGDQRAQAPVGHRLLGLAPRLAIEASMVDADRQVLLVHRPQILEDQLGQAARVAEDDRGAVRGDQRHHLGCGIAARMTRPGDGALGQQDGDVWIGAGFALDELDRINVSAARQPAAIEIGICHGGGERDAAHGRRESLEPRHRQRQQIAALGGGKGVDLVDHQRAQPSEHLRGIGIGEQQAQGFGRGQQHLRRLHPLPRLAIGRRVAGARLNADGQAHLGDRAEQVALHVDRQRLQRRDVERVQPVGRLLDQFDEAGQEACQRLARAGGSDEQRAPPRACGIEHGELVASRLPAACREPVGKDGGKLRHSLGISTLVARCASPRQRSAGKLG